MKKKTKPNALPLARYLPPADVKAVQDVLRRLYAARDIGEVLACQQQLAQLKEKAEETKQRRDAFIRRRALRLLARTNEQVAQRYGR